MSTLSNKKWHGGLHAGWWCAVSAGVNGNEWFNDSPLGFGQVECIGLANLCGTCGHESVSERGKGKEIKDGSITNSNKLPNRPVL